MNNNNHYVSMKKPLIAAILITVLILAGGALYLYAVEKSNDNTLPSAEREDCLARGGTVGTYSFVSHNGIDAAEYCIPGDSGKKCTQASDCEVSCLADTSGGSDYTFNEEGFMVGTCGIAMPDCPAAYDVINEPTKTADNLTPAAGYCM